MANKHRMEQRSFRDQSLITRVQTYMHENENKVYIDVNEMADALQRRYRDYRTRKRAAFRPMVRKAYNELTEILTKIQEKSPVQDCPAYDDFEDKDVESDPQYASSDMLLHMYKRSQHKQNGNSSDKELIDINSDTDVSEVKIKTEEKPAKTFETISDVVKKSSPVSAMVILKSKTATSKPETPIPKPEVLVSKVETPITPKTPINEMTKQPSVKSARKRQRDKDNDSGQFVVSKKARTVPVIQSKTTFSDMVISDKVLETIEDLLIHMMYPKIFKHVDISPPRGFLLHGPPGCGKTLLAHAIAGELNVPLLKVAGPELVAGISGESEARIRELFEQALALAPCIIFIDEIDAVAVNRSTSEREMEKRIVLQLLSSLDELNFKENGDKILMIGATNRPDALDLALRGRLDCEIYLGIPDIKIRTKILAMYTKKVPLAPNVNLSTIATLTPGFVGTDLITLIRKAGIIAIKRMFKNVAKLRREELSEMITEKKNNQSNRKAQTFENLRNPDDASQDKEAINTLPNEAPVFLRDTVQSAEKAAMDLIQEYFDLSNSLILWRLRYKPSLSEHLSDLYVEHNDFEAALRVVQPSTKREGFATVPVVTWDDVGSLQDIRQKLQRTILARIKHSEDFKAAGIPVASGVLLYGPPGCGKTLLAKATANEAGINFMSVKGSELLDKYVGESEKAVRQCFIRARNSMPCVIFFDELDAICPKRTDSDNSAMSRVVTQMLVEMDGVEDRQGVFLLAATNRLEKIDPAVLRPGRLDKILYVGLPTASDRVDILRALTKNGTKPKLASDVNLDEVGHNDKCEGYTGADLAALIKEAFTNAVTEPPEEMAENNGGQTEISMRHILRAFDEVQLSVRKTDIKYYEKLSKLYSVKKNSEVTPMKTPIKAPIVDVME